MKISRHLLSAFVVILLLTVTLESYFSTYSPQQASALTRPIIVDHNSVALFEQIPPEYLEAAKNTRMMFSDRSVGQNIHEALNCLTATTWAATPAMCRRDYYDRTNWLWKTYTQTDLNNGAVPARIAFTPDPIKYNRDNWTFVAKSGSWSELTGDFINTLAPSYINTKDVLSYQFSYLNVQANDNIADPSTGFFSDTTARNDIYDLERYISQHPDKTFFFWTTSLARGIGTVPARDFNERMRQYARENNKILFDVADILSHTDTGEPCYDNRDGVSYCTNWGSCENHANDGQSLPAICQDWTTETDGGHLGSTSGGALRIAKAYWVLMAQIAGWDPNGGSTPPPTPTNQAPIVTNASYETRVDESIAITLNYTDPDGPGPYTVSIVELPQHGTVAGSNTAYTYRPSPGYTGSDSFVWTVNDGQLTSTSTVTLNVLSTTTPSANVSYYWSFDTDSAVPDVGTCTSCINRGAVWTQSGYSNGGYDFTNPSGKVDLGVLPVGTSTGQFTVAAWVKPHFDENDTAFRTIFSQSGAFSAYFLPNIKDFRINLRTVNGNNFRMDTNGLAWDADTWHHIMFTYNGSMMKFYWDGQEKASANVTGAMHPNMGKFYLGVSEVSSNHFNGVIDELEVYDMALDPAQVLGTATQREEETSETWLQKITNKLNNFHL